MRRMINFLKTWPFKVVEIRADNLTSIVLRELAVEQPRYKGVYRFDGKIPVYVEGNGVVSGIFAGGLIIFSCR